MLKRDEQISAKNLLDNLGYFKLTNEQLKRTKYIKEIDSLKDLINTEECEFYVFVKDLNSENGTFEIYACNERKNKNILINIFSVSTEDFFLNIEYAKAFAQAKGLSVDDVITFYDLLLDLLSASDESCIDLKNYPINNTCIKSIVSDYNGAEGNVWVYSLINEDHTHYKRYLGIDGYSFMVFLDEDDASNQEDIGLKISKKFCPTIEEEVKEFQDKIISAVYLIEQLTEQHKELTNLKLKLFDEMASLRLK